MIRDYPVSWWKRNEDAVVMMAREIIASPNLGIKLRDVGAGEMNPDLFAKVVVDMAARVVFEATRAAGSHEKDS